MSRPLCSLGALVALLAGCSAPHGAESSKPRGSESPAAARPPGDVRAYDGSLTLIYENDKFAGEDNNYTSGFGAAWVSNEVHQRHAGNYIRRMVAACAFLPTVENPVYENFLGFRFGQEMYTPTDISIPDPPPGEQPYAGVIFLDTTVASRSTVSLHTHTLRLGLVGPSAKGEEVQTAIHQWMGVQLPEGWNTQLEDEPIINGFYGYYRRLARRADSPGAGLDLDLTADAGAGFGNYYIGANAGLVARLGFELPDNYGTNSLLGGSPDLFGLPPAKRWRVFAWFGANGQAVGRFLPTDGNTFKDSRSGERDDFIGSLAFGIVAGKGKALLSFTYNGVGGFSSARSDGSTDFGSLSLTLFL